MTQSCKLIEAADLVLPGVISVKHLCAYFVATIAGQEWAISALPILKAGRVNEWPGGVWVLRKKSVVF